MAHDTNMLRAKLRRALDNIGRNNGHACPETISNVDPALHELFVCAEAQAYWKTRYDEAKAEALSMGEGLDDAIQSVINTDAGTSVVLATGQLYALNADISKPAARVDSKKLRSYLQVEMKMSKADVDKAFDACTTKNKPATKVKVASR